MGVSAWLMSRVVPLLRVHLQGTSRTQAIVRGSPIVCGAGPRLRRNSERPRRYSTVKWSMHAHCICPTERLTWDDVCELWDGGVFTAEEMEKIATLFFGGAELRAVLKVIEKVENDSRSLEIMNTNPGDYLKHPVERKKKAA
jgi:hypothetical protein